MKPKWTVYHDGFSHLLQVLTSPPFIYQLPYPVHDLVVDTCGCTGEILPGTSCAMYEDDSFLQCYPRV